MYPPFPGSGYQSRWICFFASTIAATARPTIELKLREADTLGTGANRMFGNAGGSASTKPNQLGAPS